MIHISGAAIYPREPTQNKGTFKRICGGMKPENKGKWRPRETARLWLRAMYYIWLLVIVAQMCTNPCTKNAIRILKLRVYISGSVKQFLENNLGYCSH